MQCAICGNEKMQRFLSLGDQPPSDAFLKPADLKRTESAYPLDLDFCPQCSLVQLGYAVDPEILFREYVYNTGTNNALKANLKELVDGISKKYALKENEFVVDVGSNDGTLLQNYRPYGAKILGIDPSSATKIAIQNGIPTEVAFFNEASAKKVVSEHGRAKIITATNVFAHVDDLDSFMRGIDALLDVSGVYVSESGYVVDMIEGMQYDSIYHEHLRYYSLTALVTLFKKYDMEVVDVERITSHGGSIRVHAARRGIHPISDRVSEMLTIEKKKGFTDFPVYVAFAKKVEDTKKKLLEIVAELKKNNVQIVGIGAPAKGNTLLNYCKLDSETIDYLCEKSALKIGLYSPGMHIPVVDEKRLFEDQPGAALLLSWNIAEELMPKLRSLGYKGRFIIPNPEPRLI